MRLRARLLSPLDPERARYLDDALVEVDAEGFITRVEPWAGEEVDEDLRDGLLTPGFVDGHLHFPQTRIIGAASGPLLDWLRTRTFPEEARFADPAHARAVAAEFVDALLAAGTTACQAYGSVHPAAAEILLQALADAGLRTLAGPVLMDQGAPDELLLAAGPALDALEALAERWEGHDGRVRVAVIPRFALSCSMAMMRGAAELARRRGLWVCTHLSENPDECAATTALFQARDYLAVYEDAGLLHERSVYAHCIHLTEDEWTRFTLARAVVAHCPDSNDFLGSGGMPTGRVLDLDLPLALGTDIAAGRSFRIPRIASSAFDNALRQGRRTSPERWFWTATRGGAEALGWPEVGAIEPGRQADLVLHDLPAWVEDGRTALDRLVFQHDAPPVRRVWVRGRQVWPRRRAS